MKPYRQVSCATGSPYTQIFDGRKEVIAWSAAAWRLSDEASPSSGEFVKVAANQVVPLAKFVNSYASGESDTAVINVADIR